MSVMLHTNLRGIKCEVFCDQVARMAENFLALCASDYYGGIIFHYSIKGGGIIFHYSIKGFMIQGGNPIGTSKDGSSIWGKKFADEFRESLKHNTHGVMSMVNRRPNRRTPMAASSQRPLHRLHQGHPWLQGARPRGEKHRLGHRAQ